MEIEEKYLALFGSLGKTIQKRISENRFPAMGLTTNLDLLCEFQVEKLNELIERFLPGLKSSELCPAAEISTPQELIQTIAYFCVNGIGGEVDLKNLELMNRNFRFRRAIGGTSAQAAMALAAVGMPSVIHLTDDSKEVCKILDSPLIYTVSESGRPVHTGQLSQKNKQEVHYIIQFQKGGTVHFSDRELRVPVSNRLILTNVTVNGSLPLSQPYFSYIESNAQKFSSNVLSSFNCLRSREDLQRRLDFIRQHLKKYKRGNPKGIVFFEDAHYHSNDIKKFCMETIYPYIDIVSLNEEELKSTLALYGATVRPDDILSCVEGMVAIRRKFRVRKGVIVHTKDYSLYAGDRIDGCDIESGLIYGNLLATAKAMGGFYGTKDRLAEVVKLSLSEKGKKDAAALKNSRYGREAILVPSKYIDRPKYTIGLGDSFVAGLQICF